MENSILIRSITSEELKAMIRSVIKEELQVLQAKKDETRYIYPERSSGPVKN